MMENLRAAANHLVLKIILGLIIVSFVLTGVGSYVIGGNNNYAAEVNGQEISRTQFETTVEGERNRQQQQLGERFSELAANEGYMRTLRSQVLNKMIDKILIDQYVKSLGLRISDEQITNFIVNYPVFQVDGKFDNSRYNERIRSIGMTPDQYAQAIRNQLTAEQLTTAVLGTDFILTGELDSLIALISQQRVVREAIINVDALTAKQVVSEQEINDFYARNKNSYVAPEQYKVSYIMLDAATFKKPASDADIQAYYDENKESFTQPQRDRYRVIQTKTEAEATAILDELKNGADFATLAKTKSADTISARQGGDMGWLESATIPEELKTAGLHQKGQISGVINSSVGFLIARLDDIQPAQEKPLSEVRAEIVSRVEQGKALDDYYALQQQVSDAASNDNESLGSAEKVAGVKVVETQWFGRDNLPDALNFKPVTDIIFGGGLVGQSGAPGSNSDIITVDGDRAFVLRVSAHNPQSIKPLSEVQTLVTEQIKRQKAEREVKLEADKVLVALKQGKGDEAMKAAKLSFGKQQTLSRVDPNPIAQAAFTLSLPAANKPSYGITSDSSGDVVLLALDEVKVGTVSAEQRSAMADGLTQNNAQLEFEALISSLRQQAKIKLGDTLEQL